jgi:hypothetical protein
MKPTVQFLLYIFSSLFVQSQSSRDLPLPAANLQTLATGSYVIPMGNTLQVNASGYFNLRSYGLVIHLLNNHVKIKWVIKAGKVKDGIDFSGTAEKILPSFASATACNFVAGPFVIAAADTTGVAALVQTFYTNNSLTGNDRPAVYRLTAAAADVDVRYDLTGFIPKVAILNDGGNAAIHAGYLQKAAVPTANYQVAMATDLISRCYTFASEPHADVTAISSSKIDAVRSFVTYGGNFLAQCEAVLSYENRSNGYFQTTTGLVKENAAITPSSLAYPNADLSFSQFQGDFSISQGGSIRNWQLVAFGAYQNNAHNHANNTTGSVPVGASVSKLNPSGNAGGLVFYVGNHDFSSATSYPSVNGIRMYMNAVLTPVSLNLDCSIGSTRMYVLPLKAEKFTVSQKGGYAELSWVSYDLSSVTRYKIEVSNNGSIFHQTGLVSSDTAGTSSSAEMVYTFREPILAAKGSLLYYRLRSENNNGHSEYSEVRVLKVTGSFDFVNLFPNPVVDELRISLPEKWKGKPIVYELVDLNGKKLLHVGSSVTGGTQVFNLASFRKGYYILQIRCAGEQVYKRIVKN